MDEEGIAAVNRQPLLWKLWKLWKPGAASESGGRIISTQIDLFGRPYFGPQRVQRSQMFTRAREWPSFASAFTTEDGGPPYNFCQRGSKIGL